MNLSTIIEFFIITVIFSTPNESLRRKTIRYNNEAGYPKKNERMSLKFLFNCEPISWIVCKA